MKITFIGTSHGIPEKDRVCSAIMLECGKSVYFIDAGTNITEAMTRKGVEADRLRAVFTTHSHGDHTGGIPSLADLYNWCYTDCSVEFYLTEKKMCEAIKHYCEAAGHHFDSERLKLLLALPGKVYEDENICVSYFETKHMAHVGMASYSILVLDKKSGKRLLFSGDVSKNLSLCDFPTEALREGAELFVLEMAHIRIKDAIPYLIGAKIGRLYINHYQGPNWYPELYADVGMLNEEYGITTAVATDGLEILL